MRLLCFRGAQRVVHPAESAWTPGQRSWRRLCLRSRAGPGLPPRATKPKHAASPGRLAPRRPAGPASQMWPPQPAMWGPALAARLALTPGSVLLHERPDWWAAVIGARPDSVSYEGTVPCGVISGRTISVLAGDCLRCWLGISMRPSVFLRCRPNVFKKVLAKCTSEVLAECI
jgi:hypothetical protein